MKGAGCCGSSWIPVPELWASLESCLLLCFFFFQAEDGIRDLIVTGVQTCALPISELTGSARRSPHRGRPLRPLPAFLYRGHGGRRHDRAPPHRSTAEPRRASQIGRASCRERV